MIYNKLNKCLKKINIYYSNKSCIKKWSINQKIFTKKKPNYKNNNLSNKPK